MRFTYLFGVDRFKWFQHRGIVWVVGHTVGDDFRVTANTDGMLVLRVRGLGGAG